MKKPNINRILVHIENTAFYLAILSTIIYLYKTYAGAKNIPPGVCPLVNHRPWLYAGMALILISIIGGYLKKG